MRGEIRKVKKQAEKGMKSVLHYNTFHFIFLQDLLTQNAENMYKKNLLLNQITLCS
jgi:hypothetical protein